MEDKYIKELKNNKKIRIKYNQKNHDYCEEDGWWSEELWSYDRAVDLFKCYYPASSYEKEFYTIHTQKETEAFLREAVMDSDVKCGSVTVTDIIVEECCETISSSSISGIIIEKIKDMDEEKLKRVLLFMDRINNTEKM